MTYEDEAQWRPLDMPPADVRRTGQQRLSRQLTRRAAWFAQRSRTRLHGKPMLARPGPEESTVPHPRGVINRCSSPGYRWGMIDPGLAAVIASLVSLSLGAASIFRASLDSRTTAKREQVQRRAAAYVELLRVVETRGLAVQDDMYNLTETEDEDSPVSMPQRGIESPPRSDRAEARALAAAYGTPVIQQALSVWIEVVERWEHKRDGFVYDIQTSGPSVLEKKAADPERNEEVVARNALGDSISVALNS